MQLFTGAYNLGLMSGNTFEYTNKGTFSQLGI